MTRAEQETIIRYDGETDAVSIFTGHPPTHRRLERAGYPAFRTSTVRGQEVGWFHRVPLADFRWRVGARRRVSAGTVQRLQEARLARVPLAAAKETEARTSGAAA